MSIPTFWRALWYLVLLSVLTLASVLYTLNWARGDALKQYGLGKGWDWNRHNLHEGANEGNAIATVGSELQEGEHPVEHLMKVATKNSDAVLRGDTHNLEEAAARYRNFRGRHPPPGFDAWYAYAVEGGALIVEDFWDQIYDDLAPFWSLDPALLRKQAHMFSPKVSIRDGKVEAKSHNENLKLVMWEDMLKTLASHPHVHLPDMDIPLNVNDEPAMLVPWEEVDTAMSMVRKIKIDPEDMITEYSGLDDIESLTAGFKFDPEWLGPRLTHPDSHLGPRPLWSLVRPACPPSSPARLEHTFNDIWDPEGETSEEHSPTALLPLGLPEGTLKGYAKNWTKAMDACQWPNMQGLHGAFVAPKQMGIATKLFPLFGDSKLSMSSEILFPGAVEWNTSSSSTEPATTPWGEKENRLFWRGPATRGREPQRYWRRFHRERLISMLNATHLKIAEESVHSGNESTVGVGYATNFRLLPANEYHLKNQESAQLAGWVNGWADALFIDLYCASEDEARVCSYSNEYFSIAQSSTIVEEDKSKYAIAIDGDSGDDAGDFIRHLRIGQVTFRASIYRKWYDSRLIPWLHFIPLDNTFVDLFGVMDYFLGTDVSEEAENFSDAVGEVQKHEHHFQTPGSGEEYEVMEKMEHENIEHTSEADHDPDYFSASNIVSPQPSDLNPEIESHSSQSGNEPHIPSLSQPSTPHNPPSKRDTDAHDAAARQIAEASQQWAEKVLRREDILTYVYRLLLEYARVVDDKRERLGWVGDLLDEE